MLLDINMIPEKMQELILLYHIINDSYNEEMTLSFYDTEYNLYDMIGRYKELMEEFLEPYALK